MSSHADSPLAVTFSSVNFTTCVRQPPAGTFAFAGPHTQLRTEVLQ